MILEATHGVRISRLPPPSQRLSLSRHRLPRPSNRNLTRGTSFRSSANTDSSLPGAFENPAFTFVFHLEAR